MAADPMERMIASVSMTVRDERVLAAMRAVPRERFVPQWLQSFAFDDSALPIGEGQTIPQPTIVAMMAEALALEGDEHVLEVGTGSGYQAAILAQLAGDVVTVEVVQALRERAEQTLAALGVSNVRCLAAGEGLGAPQHAPFDAIAVTAASTEVPPPLLEQLRVGGRLVIPVGSVASQELLVVTRTAGGFTRRSLGGCRFVPLAGALGFVELPEATPGRGAGLDELRAQLASGECEAVTRAARELADAGVRLPPGDLEGVCDCLPRVRDPGRRMALVRDYVALLGPSEGPGAVHDLLRDGDAVQREAALEAAVELGEAALGALGELTHVPDRELRWYAFEAIRHIDGRAAIPLLIRGLEDEDFSIRWAASHGLIENGEAAFVAVLHALVEREPSLPFHRAALRVLRRTSPSQPDAEIGALLESLATGTTEVGSRPLALHVLHRLGR